MEEISHLAFMQPASTSLLFISASSEKIICSDRAASERTRIEKQKTNGNSAYHDSQLDNTTSSADKQPLFKSKSQCNRQRTYSATNKNTKKCQQSYNSAFMYESSGDRVQSLLPLTRMRTEAMATWYHCSSTIGFGEPQSPSLSPPTRGR